MLKTEEQLNEVDITEAVEGTERNALNILLEVFHFTCLFQMN